MNTAPEKSYRDRAHPQAPIDVGMQTLKALDEYDRSPAVKKDTPKTESAGNGAIKSQYPD